MPNMWNAWIAERYSRQGSARSREQVLMNLFLTLRPKGFNQEDTKNHREPHRRKTEMHLIPGLCRAHDWDYRTPSWAMMRVTSAAETSNSGRSSSCSSCSRRNWAAM